MLRNSDIQEINRRENRSSSRPAVRGRLCYPRVSRFFPCGGGSDGSCATISETRERGEIARQRDERPGREAPHGWGREIRPGGRARRERMGQGTHRRRCLSGKGRHRARRRAALPGSQHETHPVLRRWVPFRAGGGQSPENGVQKRRVHGRRLEGLGGSRLARRQRLTRIISRGLPPRAIPIIEERFAEEQRGRERSEEHTSELQSLAYLVCRLLLEKKKTQHQRQ